MSDFTGLNITGHVAVPGDPDWDRRARLEPRRRPAARGGRPRRERRRRRRDGPLRDRERPRVRGPGDRATTPLRWPLLEGTILIKTERMRGIESIPMRDGPGRGRRPLAELGGAAQQHDLCAMPGSSPDVGVTGFTLGGGLSWLGRRYGFACNRVQAIELVTADGEARTVDAENEPDLFWALRGGGGGYAIVTALRLRLIPIAEIYAGALVFPAELGAEAVRTYRDWAAGVSDDVTSVVRFLTPPPIPDVPEPIRGRPLLTIDGACIGSREAGEEIVAPLRELGETIMDTWSQIPAEGLCRIHMDPENPVPGLGEGMTIRELPDEAIDASAGVAGPGSGSPMLLSELRHIGGALGRPDPNGGALTHLETDFVMYSVGMPMTRSWARRSPNTWRRSSRRCSRGPPMAPISTSPSAPATPTQSCPPRSARGWPRSSASGTPTA